MKANRTRIMVLSVTVLLVVLSATVIGWWASSIHRQGWAGMAFRPQPQRRPDAVQKPVSIMTVAPGSPAWQVGLRPGDTLLKVDDVAANDIQRLVLNASHRQLGDTVCYVVDDDGEERELWVTLVSPFSSPNTTVRMVSSLLVGLGYLAISLLVFWSRPGSTKALVFYLMCASGAVLYFMYSIAELLLPSLRGLVPFGGSPFFLVLVGVFAFFGLFLTNLLLHLSLIFPRRRPVLDRWPQVLRWLHALPFAVLGGGALSLAAAAFGRPGGHLLAVQAVSALAVSLFAPRLVRRMRADGFLAALKALPISVLGTLVGLVCIIAPLPHLLPAKVQFVAWATAFVLWFIPYIGVIGGYTVCTCVALYRSYREAGIEERLQVRWPLWGTMAGIGLSFVIGLVAGLPIMITQDYGPRTLLVTMTAGVLSKLAYLLIPLSFAVAILKYRLLDIDVIIGKAVVYGGLTGFVVATYLVLVGVFGVALVSWFGVKSQMVTVISTLGVAVLFVPVRRWLQGYVDRRFLARRMSYDELRERATTAVIESNSLDEFLPRLADDLTRAFCCRAVVLWTRDPMGRHMAAAAKVGLPDEALPHLRLAASSRLLSQPGQLVALDATELSADDTLTMRRARAETAVLARLKGETVGLITVGSKLNGEALDEEDRELLAHVADQLALAIGNLQKRRAEIEYSQARHIQQSLLPAAPPRIAGVDLAAVWQPAREVGGDYYDLIPLGDGQVALCIADVVGKGMPAALLMSNLQAAVRAVAGTGVEPQRLAEQVRTVVTQSLTGGRFVTFCYVVLDLEAGRLTWANAGHNPPILRRQDGRVLRLAATGPAIARLLSPQPIRDASAELEPGDRLVLFTDGVTEAEDSAGAQLGEARLEELIVSNGDLAAEALLQSIVHTVHDHSGDELGDDVTLIVAVVESPRS